MTYTDIITDAKHKNLFDLIKEHTFIVPPYQRFYTWEKDLIEQFIDDINNGLDKKDNLFLGITLFKGKYDSKKLEIIDGQQRIITFIVLIKVLLEQNSLSREFRKKFGMLLKDNLVDGTKEFRKITLNSQNPHEFFKDFILNEENDQKKLNEIIHKYDKRVEPIKKIIKLKELLTDNFKKSELKKVSRYIENNIEVIFATTNNEFKTFDIFESINSKKMNLTIADLTKNIIFSKAIKNGVNQYKKAEIEWNKLNSVNVFKSSPKEISKFLKTYWASKYSIPRGFTFYKEFQNSKEFKKEPIPLIKELTSYANIYSELLEPRENFWKFGVPGKSIISSLNNMRYFGIKTAYPLLLQIVNTFGYVKNNKNVISDIFLKIEYLSYIHNVLLGLRPGILEEFYSKRASEISKSGDKKITFTIIQNEIEKRIEDFRKGNKFSSLLKKKKFSNKEAKYLLFRILRHNQGTNLSYNNVAEIKDLTVEHILPENPDDWWEKNIINTMNGNSKHFKDYKNYKRSEKIDAYLDEFLRLLGNLSLLTSTDNQKTANKKFPIKRKIYSKEEKRNYLFKNVIKKKNWTYKEIKKRTEELTEDLESIFF